MQTPEHTAAAGQPAIIQPRLVSTNLKHGNGLPAHWTSVEAVPA